MYDDLYGGEKENIYGITAWEFFSFFFVILHP